MKIQGNGKIVFQSDLDAAQYFIYELTRAALRDVGKFVRKRWQEAYDSHFTKRTGKGRQATSYTVYSSKKTKYPRLEIGLKAGRVDGFYAYFQEFGSENYERLELLKRTVRDNYDTIREIEAQYLTAIEKSKEEIGLLISEEDYDNED